MARTKNLNKLTQKEIGEYRGKVLEWYDRHGRELPWRYKNGEKPNPYHVWLSEIMCQQTTVQAVKPYYTKFLSTWPTVQDLANADDDDVMGAWAGLGYYARARNLHKCAKVIANDYNGKFPDSQAELIKLPGIGDYTSAAIATIAFNEPATVMDGNIERVMARFFLIEDPLPKAKKIFKTHTTRFFEGYRERPGDFAQSLMDIGSSICTPKNPKCMLCPLNEGCIAKQKGGAETLPVKIKAKNRPSKIGEVYWITNEKGEILVEKRPDKGLLANMLALPTSSWEVSEKPINRPKITKNINLKSRNIHINHVFTHFDLKLELKTGKTDLKTIKKENYSWIEPQKIKNKLPTVFKKAFVKFMVE